MLIAQRNIPSGGGTAPLAGFRGCSSEIPNSGGVSGRIEIKICKLNLGGKGLRNFIEMSGKNKKNLLKKCSRKLPEKIICTLLQIILFKNLLPSPLELK